MIDETNILKVKENGAKQETSLESQSTQIDVIK